MDFFVGEVVAGMGGRQELTYFDESFLATLYSKQSMLTHQNYKTMELYNDVTMHHIDGYYHTVIMTSFELHYGVVMITLVLQLDVLGMVAEWSMVLIQVPWPLMV